MIAYLKSDMGFSEGLTFFSNDNRCLEMVSWVRDGSIDLYCEWIVEDGGHSMNDVETSDGESS